MYHNNLEWTPQGRPKNSWRRDLEKEMWTDIRRKQDYSWRKMEAAAQDRAGWNKWSVDYVPL